MSKSYLEKHLADPNNKRLYYQESAIVNFTEAVCAYMEDNSISRSDLAERMNKSRSFISQVLNGSRNVTLRTMSDIAQAIGCQIDVRLCTMHAVEQNYPWTDNLVEKKWQPVDINEYKERRQDRQDDDYDREASKNAYSLA